MAAGSANSALDFSSWDADFDAAITMASPPQWEYRDCSRGSMGAWQPLPQNVQDEINGIASRWQRRGNIKFGGRDLVVDLQDMVAMPTDQYGRVPPMMLRKFEQTSRVSKASVKAFYEKYAQELPPADHPRGGDGVCEENFLSLFRDLEVDPGSDVAALALSAACKATEMGVFRRKEFICGCVVLQVETLEAMRKKMPELKAEVLSGKLLPDVFAYTFGVALEPPSKVIPLEEARQYWTLLLPNWPLREDFCDWAAQHMKGKTVNRDLWMMVLKFATEVPADLSTYDENPAWPVVFDDFVEFYREQKGL